MTSKLYPKSPTLESYEFVKPSTEFKRIAFSVILSIFFFFVFYLILIAVAGIIMVAGVWGGISLIAIKPSFITLALGFGIIALGVMFFIFLFKFIFSSTKNENPMRIELKEKDHPELFGFIKALTEDTKTKFPKKIFVSPDVNAMVFYNSSFWSLFFPVRKNLEIGLGLVNTLNISEFKSVLAHEFGHFSQSSMKIGSYIYTVNRVIYNLVYEYDNWDNILSQWAQTGGIFGFFAGVTFWMVERVRGLLKFAYNLININYMKLSRQMEYHADLIAISVGGNNPFKNALRKIEFSSFAYDYATGYLNALTSKEKASHNIYNNHGYCLSFLAKENKINSLNGSLQILDNDLEKAVTKSRINVKDQWASHPTLKERETNIGKVHVEAKENTDSAWALFLNPEQLQENISKKLYKIGFPDAEFQKLENSEFEAFVDSEINKYKISEKYNGFYENRYLSEFALDEYMKPSPTMGFSEIYSKENAEFIKRHNSNKLDLELLGQISLKQIPTKYFEFDGKKYKRKDAANLIKALKGEVENEKRAMEELDRQSFNLNYNQAKKINCQDKLISHYQDYFKSAKAIQQLDAINIRLQNFTNRLYSQSRWTEDQIKQFAKELSGIEGEFKFFLEGQNLEMILSQINNADQKEALKEYKKSDAFYNSSYDFDENSFFNFTNLFHDVYDSLSIKNGQTLKELTDFQLDLFDN